MGLFGPPNVQKMKAKGNVKGLIKALRAYNYKVWNEATEALVEIGKPAVEPLIAALEDNTDLRLKINAAKVLGKIGDPRAVKPLINLYPKLARQLARPNHPYYTLPGAEKHLIPTFNMIFSEALVDIGKPAVEPLIASLKHRDTDFTIAAAKALVKIYHNDLLDEHLKKKILAERKNITQHHHDRPPICAFGHEDRVLTVDFPL